MRPRHHADCGPERGDSAPKTPLLVMGSAMLADVTQLSAQYFDEWYAASIASRHDADVARLLLLPEGVVTNSSLCGPGFDEVVRRLDVHQGELVADLGCGRGQFGIELRRRSGCRVAGVDFSAVAIRAARSHAEAHGHIRPDVDFAVGELIATGLADGCADAVMSIDALFFGKPLSAVAEESKRVLRPGGRLVATGWEPADDSDTKRPRIGRALTDSGFRDVQVEQRRDWYEIEHQRWRAVAAMDDDGDAMLRSDQREAESVLAMWDERRRILVTATSPD